MKNNNVYSSLALFEIFALCKVCIAEGLGVPVILEKLLFLLKCYEFFRENKSQKFNVSKGLRSVGVTLYEIGCTKEMREYEFVFTYIL